MEGLAEILNALKKIEAVLTKSVDDEILIVPKERIKSGEIYTTKNNCHVILILDSCTRTRYGLVHKWVHIQHFGKLIAGRVCDNAEELIDRENMIYVGMLKDFISLNLPYIIG